MCPIYSRFPLKPQFVSFVSQGYMSNSFSISWYQDTLYSKKAEFKGKKKMPAV